MGKKEEEKEKIINIEVLQEAPRKSKISLILSVNVLLRSILLAPRYISPPVPRFPGIGSGDQHPWGALIFLIFLKVEGPGFPLRGPVRNNISKKVLCRPTPIYNNLIHSTIDYSHELILDFF